MAVGGGRVARGRVAVGGFVAVAVGSGEELGVAEGVALGVREGVGLGEATGEEVGVAVATRATRLGSPRRPTPRPGSPGRWPGAPCLARRSAAPGLSRRRQDLWFLKPPTAAERDSNRRPGHRGRCHDEELLQLTDTSDLFRGWRPGGSRCLRRLLRRGRWRRGPRRSLRPEQPRQPGAGQDADGGAQECSCEYRLVAVGHYPLAGLRRGDAFAQVPRSSSPSRSDSGQVYHNEPGRAMIVGHATPKGPHDSDLPRARWRTHPGGEERETTYASSDSLQTAGGATVRGVTLGKSPPSGHGSRASPTGGAPVLRGRRTEALASMCKRASGQALRSSRPCAPGGRSRRWQREKTPQRRARARWGTGLPAGGAAARRWPAQ